MPKNKNKVSAVTKAACSLVDYVKSKDEFGEPVNFNYKGSHTF